MYSKKVMEHFHHPKHMGEIKDPDGVGKIGNPTCGDVMHIYIKVGKNDKGKEIISELKVKTFGCVAAISSSDILGDMVIGKTLEFAKKLTKDDIIKELGELPPSKIHCSVLANEGLNKAIKEYENKKASA